VAGGDGWINLPVARSIHWPGKSARRSNAARRIGVHLNNAIIVRDEVHDS
jgi:hypothetical protein